MADRKRDIIVGLTALIGLVGLAVMLTIFGYMPAWTEKGYPLQVVFEDASGLSEGSRVRLAGIDIGRVQEIDLMEPANRGVLVQALIDPEIDIPRDARAVIQRPLLGGSAVLSLEIMHLTEAQAIDTLPRDGSVALRGEQASMFSDAADSLKDVLEGPTAQLEQVAERFTQLSDQWELVGANINHLIEPRQVADVDAGEGEGNLATVLARTDQRLAELQQVLAGINRYTNDEELYQDIRATAAGARELTGRAGEVADSAQQHIEQISKQFVAVADDLSGTIASATAMLEQARNGEGAIGRLLNDPALYNNVNDAAQRMQAALDEVTLLMQKWREEGVPIQF